MTEAHGVGRGARSMHLAVSLLLALVTVAAFLPALQTGFVDWDDRENFLQNPHYRGLGWPELRWMFTTNLMGHWIPLSWISLGLDYVIWGMDPFGYHLTSLLLHAAAAVALYLVSLRLLAAALPPRADRGVRVPLGAAIAALLWALHPLRVESVAWVTERRDVLSGLLFLLAVLAYLLRWDAAGGPRPAGRRLYGLSLGLFAAALMAKAMTVSLPVVLLILDVYPLRRLTGSPRSWLAPPARAVLAEKIPFVLLGLAASVGALLVSYQTGTMSPVSRVGVPERAAISFYSLAFYLWKSVVPLGLSPMYELPDPLDPLARPFVLSLLAVVAISAVAVRARGRWPALLASWVVYVVMVLPVVGIVQSGFQIAADRYAYLPTLGWGILAAGTLVSLAPVGGTGRARGALAVGQPLLIGAALGGLGLLTWAQVQIWHDTGTLWRYALEAAASSIAHNDLGLWLVVRGEVDEGVRHLETALRMRPGYAEAHSNLGLALARQGRPAEAIAHYREATRLKPRYSEAWSNLGAVLASQGAAAEAVAAYREAIRAKPANAQAHTNLGASLDAQGKPDEARAHLEEAVRLRPDYAEARGNLGVFLARRSQLAEAARHFEHAVRLRPDSAEAHNHLGLALAQHGRLADAAQHFHQAVRLRPGYGDARDNLNRALAEMRDQGRR